jgi:hypothetical protein
MNLLTRSQRLSVAGVRRLVAEFTRSIARLFLWPRYSHWAPPPHWEGVPIASLPVAFERDQPRLFSDFGEGDWPTAQARLMMWSRRRVGVIIARIFIAHPIR